MDRKNLKKDIITYFKKINDLVNFKNSKNNENLQELEILKKRIEEILQKNEKPLELQETMEMDVPQPKPQSNYYDFFLNSPLPEMIFDNKGDITHANKASTELFGYTKNELESMNIKTILTKESFSELLQCTEILDYNITCENTLTSKNKKGNELFLSAAIRKVSNTETAMILEDDREDLEARMNLKKNEQIYKAYIKNAPYGIAIFDGLGDFLEVNKALCTITGYSEHDLIGLNVKSIIADGQHDEIVKFLFTVRNNHELKGEFFLRTEDGSEKIVSIYGMRLSSLKFIGFIEDITEKTKTETELKKKEIEMERAQRMAHLGNFMWNLQTGKVDLSAESFRIFGLLPSANPPSVKRLFSLIHKEDREEVDKALEISVKKKRQLEMEFRFKRISDNMYRYIFVKGDVQYDEEGESRTLSGIVQDITNRKKIENLLREGKEKAEEESISKSKFLANMSHEIRTSINGIVGMIDLMALTHLDSEQKEYTTLVKSASNSLLRIVNDIVDYSKIESGILQFVNQAFNICDLIEDTVSVFRVEAERKKLELTYSVDDEIDYLVIGDSLRVKQIFSNVLENAVKFTENGKVEVRVVEKTSVFGKVVLNFKIIDTGIGIAEDKIDKIFEGYTNADESLTRKHKGVGLGLAITRELVNLMGGKIMVESKPGKGTTFSLDLQFKKAFIKNKQSIQEELEMDHTYHGSAMVRILAAEDEYINQRLIKTVLEKKGWQADITPNGKEAVKAFESGSYDLVLMDVQMPEMDGLEAAREIRRIEERRGSGHIPIIALTAHALKTDREKCRNAGMDDFLVKPIRTEQLLSVLSKYV